MIILSVKFKSSLPHNDVLHLFEQRTPNYRALSGLIQKYYGYEQSTGEYTGIYLWDSEQAMREFRESDLAHSIPEAYHVEGKPRIEIFEVSSVLRS